MSSHCPAPEQWNELLDDVVSEPEKSTLESHLETCESCRHRLEQLAADRNSWNRASAALSARRHEASQGSALQRVIVDAKAIPDSSATGNDHGGGNAEVSLDFLAPSDSAESLGKLGGYEIIEVIGRGGMGVVFRGQDVRLNRFVAIKVLAPELACNANARKRFRREGQAAAAVSHDHVLTIHAVDEANGMPYLVMEYIPGKSLQGRINSDGTLDLNEILRIGMQTASGLAAAHAQGLVHRDIKPANILLENGVERVKISDFGLARAVDDVRVTQPGVVTGTPEYMSPEQARGEKVDHRSDLFSLGCVLYTMCTGRPPFRAESTVAMINRICTDAPRPIQQIRPEIPDWLAEIVDRLLEKHPDQRIQSAAEVEQLLAGHLAHLQEPSVNPQPARLVRSIHRDRTTHRGLVGRGAGWLAGAAAILLLVAGLGFSETAGVSDVASTVIRWVRGDAIVEIKVDDPDVEVAVGDEELTFTGPGIQTVRVRPGTHKLRATKAGTQVYSDSLTIHRGEKQLVQVTVEASETARKVTTDSVVSRRVASDIDIDYAGKPSSDGRLLPYVDFGGGKILVRDFSDNSDRQIAEWTWSASRSELAFCDGVPVLSPDGDRIAYTWFREGVWELRTTALDGSDTQVIYRNEADVDRVEPHDWSPDGKHILALFIKKDVEGEPALVRGTSNMALVSVADGQAKIVLPLNRNNVSRMRFSPDGQYIAYDRRTKGRQRDIYVLSVSGFEPIPVVEHPKDDALIGWAPSGDKLLFTSNRLGNRDVWSVDFNAGATKGSPAIVKTGFGDVRWLGITPGGEVFYATSARMLLDVYTVAFDSKTGNADSAPEKISLVREGASTSPDWSRDSKQLAYVTAGRRRPAVVIHSLESGEYEEHTLELGSIRGKGARWSPDGGSLVLAGFDKEGRRGIYRVDAQTGEVTVVKQGYISQPEWTPDGESIIYCRANPDDVWSGHTEIIARAVESGEEHRLLEFQGAGLNSSFALSPDGSQLAFMVHEEGTVALNVASVSKGQPRELHRVEKPAWMGRVDWAPDESFVLFEHRPSEDSTELWRVPAQGGTAEKIPLSTGGIKLAGYIYPRIHPDGQRIAFTASAKGALSEVRVIDNLFDHADGQEPSSR